MQSVQLEILDTTKLYVIGNAKCIQVQRKTIAEKYILNSLIGYVDLLNNSYILL